MPRLSAAHSFSIMAVIAALLVLAPPLPARAAAGSSDGRHTVKPVEFTLANGLKVVLISDHRAPVVTHSIWYRVGATDDPPHSHGLAHFLEHMMFKGTDRFPAGVFNETVSRIGGAQNAVTTDSFTYYFQIVPKAHLAQMMEMESDRMTNLRMNESEVASERTVILQERRGSLDDNFKRRLFVKVHQALYGSHALSTDLIGSQEEILAFKREDAMAFYRRHYVPGNAVLVISGDVDEAELRVLVEKTYGRIPAGEVPKERPVLAPLPPLAGRAVSISDGHVGNPIAWLVYRLPGLQHMQFRELASLSILSQIVGSDTGRLRKSMVLPGIALEATSDVDAGFGSRFVVGANSTDTASLTKVVDGMKQAVRELVENGVTQAELDLERADFLAAEIYRLDYQSLLAIKYGNAMMIGLSVDELGRWIDEVKAVTVDDINAVARKYLLDDVRVSAEAWPTTASASATSPVAPVTQAPAAAEGAR